MRVVSVLLVLAFATLPSWAQEPETDRVLRLVAALESSPLSGDSTQQREWLLEWLTQTEDYTVVVCDILGPIPSTDVPYGRELLVQSLFGNVAYQIKNPGVDPTLSQLAGVESVLRAYSAILKQDPGARIAYFDELVALQQRGGLAERLTPIVAEKCRSDSGA